MEGKDAKAKFEALRGGNGGFSSIACLHQMCLECVVYAVASSLAPAGGTMARWLLTASTTRLCEGGWWVDWLRQKGGGSVECRGQATV